MAINDIPPNATKTEAAPRHPIKLAIIMVRGFKHFEMKIPARRPNINPPL